MSCVMSLAVVWSRDSSVTLENKAADAVAGQVLYFTEECESASKVVAQWYDSAAEIK